MCFAAYRERHTPILLGGIKEINTLCTCFKEAGTYMLRCINREVHSASAQGHKWGSLLCGQCYFFIIEELFDIQVPTGGLESRDCQSGVSLPAWTIDGWKESFFLGHGVAVPPPPHFPLSTLTGTF